MISSMIHIIRHQRYYSMNYISLCGALCRPFVALHGIAWFSCVLVSPQAHSLAAADKEDGRAEARRMLSSFLSLLAALPALPHRVLV